jgi:PAS domain S-box-containing protein
MRTFGRDEVIVSKTDLQGRITYVNDVFLRIAQYDEDEVMGKPHNIIRHPAMPRAVFALLWQEIEAGREIFAYVENLAKDGAGYWVFAHVTPTFVNGRIVGYHSNRRSPDASAIAAISPIYAALVAEEEKYGNPKDAIRASTAILGRALETKSMTYDQFVWSLTKESAL